MHFLFRQLIEHFQSVAKGKEFVRIITLSLSLSLSLSLFVEFNNAVSYELYNN